MTRTVIAGSLQWSPKQDLTIVHCCDPAISVLDMLVSRDVFHVVSALQSLSRLHIFLADQASCRSYVGSVYGMRSLAVCVTRIYLLAFFVIFLFSFCVRLDPRGVMTYKKDTASYLNSAQAPIPAPRALGTTQLRTTGKYFVTQQNVTFK